MPAAAPRWLRRLGYYGLALLFVAAAALLRWKFQQVLSPVPTLVFYLAWVGAAAFGGLGPGLLATAASWLCIDLFFDPTPGQISFADPTSVARLLVLLAGGLVVSLVGEKMRRTRIRERRQGRKLTGTNAVLRESQERLRQRAEEVETLMDLVPVGIWVAYDPQCNHIVGNQAASRLYEASREENVSANVSPVRRFFRDGQELKPEELPMQEAAAQNIDIRDVEVDVLLPSGTWRNVLGSARPLHDAEGRVRGCLGAFVDITARKRAVEALRESEEKYRYIVETATEGIVMVDANARVIFVNERWSEIFGYSLDEAKQMTHFDMVFPEDQAEMRERWESRKRGVKENYEFRFQRKDGRPIWTLIGVAPRFDPEGRFLGTLVMVTDITQRKHAEEALRELTTMLESKVSQRTAELRHRAKQLQKLTLDMSVAEDRERERMAEILHDDLQQVLAAARFHVGLMRNRAKHDASLQTTVAQVDHMLKDAIDKSRSLSHELSPAVMRHGDFTETLRWLAGEMQSKHGFLVHVQAHGQTHLRSNAIKSFLYKTAQELLFNAIKHAGVKEARIRVRQCGRCVCLSVSDRGCGFDPGTLRETAGFGLLSIRERIELMGGRMKIKSAAGKGSKFSILVPIATEEGEKAGTDEDRKLSSSRLPTFSPSDLPPGELRVLLADDHEIVRQGIAALLREETTIQVVGEAADGREAINLAHQLHPDVVIMDVSMPLMNGEEATRQIKRHLPEIRIVALSMYEEPETIERMRQAGAEGYVLKTAPPKELLAAIQGEKSRR